MNFYNHWIGDYGRDTAHLSMTEDGAYRRLMDALYSREKPLPLDERTLFRMTRAIEREEQAAVRYVLEEFWVRTEDGWIQPRAMEEIEKAREKGDQARRNGQRGGRPKKPSR